MLISLVSRPELDYRHRLVLCSFFSPFTLIAVLHHTIKTRNYTVICFPEGVLKQCVTQIAPTFWNSFIEDLVSAI